MPRHGLGFVWSSGTFTVIADGFDKAMSIGRDGMIWVCCAEMNRVCTGKTGCRGCLIDATSPNSFLQSFPAPLGTANVRCKRWRSEERPVNYLIWFSNMKGMVLTSVSTLLPFHDDDMEFQDGV
jgi:hypothetical protein